MPLVRKFGKLLRKAIRLLSTVFAVPLPHKRLERLKKKLGKQKEDRQIIRHERENHD